jgi:hypothetical protein
MTEMHEEAVEIIRAIMQEVNGEKPLSRPQLYGFNVIAREIRKLPEYRLVALLIATDKRIRKVLYEEEEMTDGETQTGKQTPP